MDPTKDREWNKRLRAHNRKLLAMIIGVFLAYFAALIAVCYLSVHRAMHSIEHAIRSSGHSTRDQ